MHAPLTAQIIIAGPCSIESEEHAFECAASLAGIGVRRMRGGCWKPRTSPHEFQGHGVAALRWMRAACDRHGLELWTEVRDIANLTHASMIDVPWIGARNAQNFELLRAVGRQFAGRSVVLKRGPWLRVREWIMAGEYLRAEGANPILCERGLRGFDPELRNALDIAGALLAREQSGWPVLVDPSHGTGVARLVLPMARAALAAGVDGVMVEAHPRPASALTDAAQAVTFDAVRTLLP